MSMRDRSSRAISMKVDEKMAEYPQELADLVSIASVSSDSSFESSMYECAAHLSAKLDRIGIQSRVIKAPGYPLVVGRVQNKKASRTLAIYNHYDVQPAINRQEWNSNPFELVEKGDKWFGRGAKDNKGNLLVGLKAVELALEENVPLNFQFIYEGEEEIGSPHLKVSLEQVKEFLDPDIVIVGDVGWLSRDRPTIVCGHRGLLYMHWSLRTATKSAHSGSVGGAARNPLLEIAKACSQCIDPTTGRILIPGIYDNVRQLEQDEIQDWLKSGFEIGQFKEQYGLSKLRSEQKIELLKSIWARPTFEPHGLISGYMKRDGQMTVVPKDAQLLVSMRLVADQCPERIFKLVQEYVYHVNPDIELKEVSAIRPYLGKCNSSNIHAASRALIETSGLPVVKIRTGGAIGATAIVYEMLGNPEMLLLGFGLPEHGSHGPNEYFDKEMAHRGIEAYYRYFKEVAESQ